MNEGKIKDSGNRTEFGTGAVRDMHEEKGRYDLLPWDAIHELALHCEQGTLKYGERNCEKGIPIHSLIDSGIRHLSCYLRGMKDELYLRAAFWNIGFALWMKRITLKCRQDWMVMIVNRYLNTEERSMLLKLGAFETLLMDMASITLSLKRPIKSF